MAAEEGGVHAHRIAEPAEVQGVNNRRHLAAVETAWQERARDALMDEGVTLRDPARTMVLGQVTPAPDVVVDPGCQFEGQVVLGEGARIGPHCVLRNCRISPGAVIEAHSHIEGATVGPGAGVGPFARLRPETVLEQGAKVGNFVEVKKAHLGPGVKANHLSYVGDAEVGAGANLGAGTITCNYDGHRKHGTTIGAGAFIGSAVQLVAPVSVGEGATIGAGSTITKDAPAHTLTLSRAKQVTIKDWKRPEQRAQEEQD
jgi:bifunctional UDP-N-acetylglucosamine pyrophosphorylase/glucosamine-1-phosphate N-acetyltransferase